MPAISMFYGIIIYLYFFDNERHKLPHVHARYQGQEASFAITDGSILGGEIPLPKARLVQAWIEIHREELIADWELAVNRLLKKSRNGADTRNFAAPSRSDLRVHQNGV